MMISHHFPIILHEICVLFLKHLKSRHTYLGIDSECSFKPQVFEDSDCSQQHVVACEREIVEVE